MATIKDYSQTLFALREKAKKITSNNYHKFMDDCIETIHAHNSWCFENWKHSEQWDIDWIWCEVIAGDNLTFKEKLFFAESNIMRNLLWLMYPENRNEIEIDIEYRDSTDFEDSIENILCAMRF
jgi:hypothetical protein